MIKHLLIATMLITLAGCTSNNSVQSVKPTFPRPSQHTLDKIKGLNDTEVNLWMEDLFKCNRAVNW